MSNNIVPASQNLSEDFAFSQNRVPRPDHHATDPALGTDTSELFVSS